ncbi:glycogen synthase GlgA [Methylolobus aquaticus]
MTEDRAAAPKATTSGHAAAATSRPAEKPKKSEVVAPSMPDKAAQGREAGTDLPSASVEPSTGPASPPPAKAAPTPDKPEDVLASAAVAARESLQVAGAPTATEERVSAVVATESSSLQALEQEAVPAPEPAVLVEPVSAAAPATGPENVPEPETEPAPSIEGSLEPESEPSADNAPDSVAAPEPTPRPSMFIVHITPEIAPVAKVGGLADVVFGLAKEQEIRGNHVEIILPKYDSLRYDQVWGLTETYNDLWVPWYGGSIHCTVYFGFAHGRKCFFIEPHSADNFFNRGCIYGFNDDILRFAFFSRAALEFLWKSGKHPDIIHCHDWQTALVPVFLYEIYQHLGMTHPRVCFTIHNFKHQGVTGANLLHATGLNRPEYYFHYDRLRDNNNVHAINLTKGGIVYSNFITTVSPRHAVEAKDHGEGFGLEPTLHIHHQKYGGVLNGIDYEAWNPEIDHYIPFHYTADTIEDKYRNKIALRDRLLLSDNEKPIVAFIGRLDPQKGLELIRHAMFYTLHRNGQFILLGSSPDSQINNYFWGLKHQLNDNPDCHLEIGFNEELSHLIYSGADMVIVPSRFEPCGLTQMIAMRYGTVPVVREVGGLADTVFDKDYSHRPLHERNGYIFRDYDFGGLESALGRAISCYYEYPEHFRELMKNAMRYDYSWNHPGQHYMNIYDYIREK